jgi:hypothetical protein
MLHHLLSEHAAGCFFSDDKMAAWLWDTLLDPVNKDWHALHNHCYQLLVEGIDGRHPREYRLTDIRQLMSSQCGDELFISSQLPWLDELAGNLLIRNGDLIHYQETKVEAYVRLSAELDPTLLVGWQLADWLQQNPKPYSHDIIRVISAQSPFFAPPTNTSLPFAEGHVHLWGVTSENIIFSQLLLTNHTLKKHNHCAIWASNNQNVLSDLLSRAKKLLHLLLQTMPLQSHDEMEHSEIWPKILEKLNNPMHNLALPDWSSIVQFSKDTVEGSSDWLLTGLAQVMQQSLQNSWLWLQVFLCRNYQDVNSHPLHRVAILCFWQTCNALRRHLIMDGQGLTRFVERYNGSQIRGIGKPYQDNIRSIFSGVGDVAEIKSSPMAFNSEFISQFSSALLEITNQKLIRPPYVFGEHEIEPNANTFRYLETLERWHFCGHFSRSKIANKGKRAKPDLKLIWKEAEKLMRRLNQHSGWNKPEFLGGKLNPNFHFQPSRWFRGLDIAGDENALKIESFAPMLRWLRSGLHSKSTNERANKDFHFSIHAGEDYAHPISGMRHIDETVRFCEMRDGDRLGHALALGIEPSQWANRQGEMILPVDEHLDNLVWLWHYATVLSGKLPLAQQVIPLLERRIVRFYSKCDWLKLQTFHSQSEQQTAAALNETVLEKLTPDILYRAWLLRRNCYYQWQQLLGSKPLTAKEVCALPDWERLADKDKLAAQLYFLRHSSLLKDKSPEIVIVRIANEWDTQSCISVPKNQKLRGRSNPKQIIEDVDTPAELEFMQALQDYLLTQYDSMGLIIETNPTSNVYIARLKNHKEHPIFRWSPPDESLLAPGGLHNRFGLRQGPVRVLVNTDDPGIMPTTLRTEYLLLREAARDLGVGRTIAERWLESLRQYGIEQFHRNHLPVFEPI